jgi:hypothetical protein
VAQQPYHDRVIEIQMRHGLVLLHRRTIHPKVQDPEKRVVVVAYYSYLQDTKVAWEVVTHSTVE